MYFQPPHPTVATTPTLVTTTTAAPTTTAALPRTATAKNLLAVLSQLQS